ncbi:hypothetical protein ACLD5Z_02880 [Gardnerella piotii]|uniref:hypothetical protein n=1 Tax=Gardnerella piotii TaxID=2792977 RepID=UPI003970DA3D
MKNAIIDNIVKEKNSSSICCYDISTNEKYANNSENLNANDELNSSIFATKLMNSYKQSVSGLVRSYESVFNELEKD